MANTRIVHKRSATNATIPALFQGELCYSQNGTGQSTTNSGLLYVGQPSDNAARIIGGTYAFGVLTANQAVVTNATSYVDKFLTANLTAANAFITTLYANGIVGNTTSNVLMSNATGGVYWGFPPVGGGGTVTNIAMGNGLTSTQSPLTSSGTMSANIDGSLKFTSGAMGVNAAATSGLVANATGVWVQAANGLTVNATGFIAVNSSGSIAVNSTGVYANAGGSIVANATGIHVNAAATSSLTANATGLWVLIGNGHTVNSIGYIAVNSSPGISVNSTGTFVNLATTSGLSTTSGLTTVIANGMSLTAAGLNVNAAATSGLLANASGLWVQVGNGHTVNATGFIAVNSSLSISVNTTGVFVNTAATPGLNTSAGLTVYAGPTLTLNATGTHVNSTLSIQDLTLAGNLTVSGTLVSLNATDLLVKDNMIQLAANQSGQGGTFLTGDAVDSGLYFQIGNSSSNACFSGFSRLKNALGSSNTQPYFKIWAGNTAPSTTTVTASNTGYLESFLVPYGSGGLFVCNGTNISLSSNATVALAISGGATTTIAAGTLQLTTALPVSNIAAGSDGGVLQTTTGSGVNWSSTLDGGTF